MRVERWSGLVRFLTVLRLFLGIFWAFYSLKIKRIWHTESWVESRRRELYASQARHFRHTAVKLGGLLIKLGQFFSTRVDVLPQASIRELVGLQDEVEPVGFDKVRKLAEAEFGRPLNDVFEKIEENPIASASLGQVHPGVLANGKYVAIKIQRPGIEELVRIDLKAMQQVIAILKRFSDLNRLVNFDAIYREFAQTVWDELDYINEGHNAETIASNNAEDKELLIPRIFWDYTTRRVLTMEFEEGIKITDYESLAAAGVNRQAVARKLVQVYVKQVLVDGFFHADPHPGNLFVTPAGKLVMIDFGMVGTISPSLREVLVKTAIAMVKRDHLQVVAYLKHMGFLRADADAEVVARAIGVLMEHVLGSGQELVKSDLAAFLEDLEQLLYEQPFQIPANFTFLGRALGTLYGLCIGLDPNISFLDEAKPFVADITGDKRSWWSTIKDEGTAIASSLLELPYLAGKVLRRADRGDLVIRIPLNSLNETIRENTRALSSLAWALVFGFTLGTSAYLLVNHLVSEARWGFGFSGVVFLIMLNRGRGRRGRRAPHPPMVIKRGNGD